MLTGSLDDETAYWGTLYENSARVVEKEENEVKKLFRVQSNDDTFSEMDVNSVNFRELNDRIIKAEDDNQKTVLQLIYSYYYFGKGYRLWFDHYKKTYSDDTSNSLVNDKIRECFPD
ncbi:10288_t:CDS:2 [Funneliformis caledonium]|uniref:10288_t:CDS:1 n=1 Tax=Funneliformis caledonium TaxID=1117310 RepID=A0A9N9CW24_9GLOM|nr:10288_t:CDS:2 [Funneliformis caledonium]